METKKLAFPMEDDMQSVSGRSIMFPFGIPSGGRTSSPSLFRRSVHSTHSAASSVVSVISHDALAQPLSCVTRGAPKDRAVQRFLVWAAIRRNACSQMREDKRLECPLLLCKRRFSDHESMLRHIVACEYLASCQYWCYEHMQVERFDESSSRQCLESTKGQGRKTRKILCFAKNVIASLSHKDKASSSSSGSTRGIPDSSSLWSATPGHGIGHDVGEDDCTRENDIGVCTGCSSRSGSKRNFSRRRHSSASNTSASGPPCSPVSPCCAHALSAVPPSGDGINEPGCVELPSTEIVEIDSREVGDIHRSIFTEAAREAGPANVLLENDLFPEPGSVTVSPLGTPFIAPVIAPTPSPPPLGTSLPPNRLNLHALPLPSPPTSAPSLQQSPTLSPSPPPSSINPQELCLAELDSDSLRWDPTMSRFHGMLSMDTVLQGKEPSAALFQKFLALRSRDDHLECPGPESKLTRHDLQESESFLMSTQPPAPPATQTLSPVLSGQRSPRPSSGSRKKALSPSTSVRSTTSTTSAMSAMSATSATSTATALTMASTESNISDASTVGNAMLLVSPNSDCSSSSNDGDLWSDAVWDTGLTSPSDDLWSPVVDGGCTYGKEPRDPTGACVDAFECLYTSGTLLGPFDPISVYPDCDHATNPKLEASTERSIIVESEDTGRTDIANSIPTGSEAVALVKRLMDVLCAHVNSSLRILQEGNCSSDNSVAQELRTLTWVSITELGLRALQNLLLPENEDLSPLNTVCLLHLVYSFSSTALTPLTVEKSNMLFSQALAYSQNFTSPQREHYLEVVAAVWKPGDMSLEQLRERVRHYRSCHQPLKRSLSFNGKDCERKPSPDGPIVSTAQAFLDKLEMSALSELSCSFSEIQSSDLFQQHLARGATSSCSASTGLLDHVLDSLLQQGIIYPDATHCVNGLRQKLSVCTFSSTRQLELELLRVGEASPDLTAVFFGGFAQCVRNACDSVYASLEPLDGQRSSYYLNGINLMRSLFSAHEIAFSTVSLKSCDSSLEAALVSTESMPDFAGNLDENLFASPHILTGAAFTAADELSVTATTPQSIAVLPNTTGQVGIGASVESIPVPAMLTAPRTTAAEELLPEDEDVEMDGTIDVGNIYCCDICGYKPTGHPQWFRGSMAKHKKTMHSADIIYKCPVEGCTSQYRNRADNLLTHQKRKNHWGPGQSADSKRPRGRKQVQKTKAGPEDDAATGRPVKRPRV